MSSPIMNKMNTIFVHVSDLERSVKWYAELLGQEYDLTAVERPVYNIKIADHTGLTLDAGGGDYKKAIVQYVSNIQFPYR